MGRRRSGVAIVTTTGNNHGDSDFSVTWHYFCHLETDCFFFLSIMYFVFFSFERSTVLLVFFYLSGCLFMSHYFYELGCFLEGMGDDERYGCRGSFFFCLNAFSCCGLFFCDCAKRYEGWLSGHRWGGHTSSHFFFFPRLFVFCHFSHVSIDFELSFCGSATYQVFFFIAWTPCVFFVVLRDVLETPELLKPVM